MPGKGWDEENNCYKDELHEDEFASDHEPDEEKIMDLERKIWI